ncbi:MAG: hypothetical protein ACYSW7_12590 [Planctomycetota bacterium]
MNDDKERLLGWIDEDRDKLVDFLSRFIQAKSPNPPGDTRAAAAHITHFLDENALRAAPRSKRPHGCLSRRRCQGMDARSLER